MIKFLIKFEKVMHHTYEYVTLPCHYIKFVVTVLTIKTLYTATKDYVLSPTNQVIESLFTIYFSNKNFQANYLANYITHTHTHISKTKLLVSSIAGMCVSFEQ